MTWPVHKAAELFPMLSDDELRTLADDIKANGLHEPIWLWDDDARGSTVLLDGRNRLAACDLAGVDVETRMYEGNDPIGFVLSQNLHRRHLTVGQRAAVAASIREFRAAEAAQRMKAGVAKNPIEKSQQGPRGGLASHQAGKEVGVSEWAVDAYRRVEREAPELAEQVKTAEITLGSALTAVKNNTGKVTPRPRMMPIPPGATIVANVANSLHAAAMALAKVELDGAKEEVAGWIGDLEDPLRTIRKTIRAWKEQV